MQVDARQLLRRLDPAVRPGSVGHDRSGRAPIESRGFDELLSLVADGSVSSGRAVRVEPQFEEPLTDEQLEALASAADRAERAGAERAVVLLESRGLLLDVPERTVRADLAEHDDDLVQVDAVVRIGSGEPKGAPLAPPWGAVPPALAAQLALADTD